MIECLIGISNPFARLLRFPNLICTQIRQKANPYTTEIESE